MAQESILRIVIDSRNAERNAQNIARELQSIERNGDHASRSMDSMSVATRSLVGYMGGLVTIGAAINKMDTYTGLQNRLKLVTDSQGELNTAMNDTFAIAQKTASSWDSTAMVYQRFADSADRLGISMKQTASLTETVSKAISVSGGSAASAEAALMQFGQALASGVLRGEEFNSIAEQAPGLLKAIAFGLDTNIGSLRAMAGEGKITGDVLVDALGKAKPYIDDLFNKTDFTISQSFTQLSNEVTKFVGEAGKGSGAAAGLSAAIGGLSDNLGTIANIAVVGGVALLTKTILTQTVAIQGSIVASIARRAALLTEIGAQAAASAAEVRRTAALAQFTAMQLADAQATAARMVGLQRHAYIEATVLPLRAKATQMTAAHTAATAADTVVQNVNNVARARSTMLLGLVGGPIGAITLGVAGLAAGYMYLKSRTAEANAKLEEQGKIADQTDEELKKLSGNDKISSVEKLTETFESQNAALAKSKESVDAVLFAIRAASVENEKARKVTEDARKGVISYDEAIKRLNQMNIPTDLYDMLKKQVIQYDENSVKAGKSQYALKILGKEVTLTGNLFQNSAVQIDSNTTSINKNETAAQKAAKAQKEYAASLFDRNFDANFSKNVLAAGISEGETKALLEAANYARKKGVEFTKEMAQEALHLHKLEKNVQDTLDARNEAEKKITKEKEKQLKLGQRLIGISGNSGIGTGAHLDVRYGGSRDGQKVSKEHLARLQAGGKSLASYKVSSDYGQRKAPTKGASSFHKGIDFAMPVNTPITTNVAVKDVKTAYDSKGGGYYSTVTFEDGVVLKLLHQAPSAMSKIKGGSSDGTLKANQDIEKQAEQQANTQLQLQMAVATERKRIETQLQEDIKEINKAGFSPEETKRLISEYQARADNDIAIAQYALKTKLNDYESFRKSEETLLKESFDQKKFYAARDLELSKEDRKKAVALLESQYQQELALVKLAKEQRIFQAEQAMMTEIQVMQERYRFERDEIIKTTATDLDERRRRLNALNTNVIRGGVGKNFSDPNDTSSQFLRSVSYAPIPESNTQRLDNEFAKEQAKMLANFEKTKELNAANHEAILEAERQFLDAKQQLQDEYDFKAQDARRMDYEHQLSIYGQMTSMVGSSFGQMMDIVSQVKEENTKTYKTFFAINKAIAFAQAIINTEEGATKALAQGGIYGAALAMAVRASGYASAGIIAGQAIAGPGGEGYANGGYTGHGGKYEPAGIVHKGEGVLTKEEVEALGGPQGFEDLRKSIRRGYSTGGLVTDTKRVGIGALDAINNGGAIQAEKQAQANAKVQSQSPQIIDNQLRVLFVKDEQEAKDMLYGPDGEKAFLYHMKRNRSKV
ncbi:tape measure protein [Acinetobacter bohemicus]|uniref:tape measure protein n=1 Tax=Acinetobacter bohemicus TaxID=1435036 RepID=UPI0040437986